MESISKFAEELIGQELNSIHEGKAVAPSTNTNTPKAAPAGKDIRNISVPDEFMQQILGESYHPQETISAEEMPEIVWTDSEEEAEEVSKNSTPEMLTESTAQNLIPLLEEVRNLLREMTAATTGSGNIGVNFAGPQASKGSSWAAIEKKYGYKKALKPTLSNNRLKRKKALRQSIKRRIKKK